MKIVVLLLLVLVCIFRNRLFLLCGLVGSSRICSFWFSFIRCCLSWVILLVVILCSLGLVSMVCDLVSLCWVLLCLCSVVVIGLSCVYLCESVWKCVLLLIIFGWVSSKLIFLWCLVRVLSLVWMDGVMGGVW